MPENKAEEIIKALRCSGSPGGPESCDGCPYLFREQLPKELWGACGREYLESCDTDRIVWEAANRLEALLAENERLKAGKDTDVPTKWVSVEERLPHFNQPYIVTACDENAPAGEGIWYSTVVVVAEYYNGCWTWYEGYTEYDLTGLVTHWQPFPEPPSTEGVTP